MPNINSFNTCLQRVTTLISLCHYIKCFFFFFSFPILVLLIVCGFCVNGPYALITTAVSADLGTHSSLNGDARALATVTAIIDGTGSMGE